MLMITLYRYSVARGYNTVRSNTADLILEEFIVVKETPCGYWYIPKPFYRSFSDPLPGTSRSWVSKSTRKRYCYPTTEEAFNSFTIRTRRRSEYLRDDLEMVENALRLTQDDAISTSPSSYSFHASL